MLRVGIRWFFFFQAEDGIRDYKVTGVQTCALPILPGAAPRGRAPDRARARIGRGESRAGADVWVWRRRDRRAGRRAWAGPAPKRARARQPRGGSDHPESAARPWGPLATIPAPRIPKRPRAASSLRYGERNAPLPPRRYCVASTRTYGVGNRSATTLLRTTRRAYRSTHGEVNHATPRRLHPCCSRRPRARRLSGDPGSPERP